MKKAEMIRLVEECLKPFAAERGYEIVDVDFVKEGSNWYLKVFGDKEGGFSINDCVDTSHYLDEQLEIISDPAFLAGDYHTDFMAKRGE